MNSEVNAAILEAFRRNLISSTTIMANMPGFEEACGIAHREKLADKIGLQLNITEGVPLSDRIRHCPRLCDERGQLRRGRRIFHLNPAEKVAVEEEFEAQVR